MSERMKGIVFTEFTDMVEEKFGLEVLEEVLARADLPNRGAYTSIGTYPHEEIIRMVGQLSAITTVEGSVLVRIFGEHLFNRLAERYPQLVAGVGGTFALMASIGPHIHVEVRKLYPDAGLPSIEARMIKPGSMEVMYRSTRPFGDLAEGLIRGCIRHFGEAIELEREAIPVASGHAVRFQLFLNPIE